MLCHFQWELPCARSCTGDVEDDSSGGWVPLGGGGLSNVSVRKKPRPSPSAVPGPDPSSKPKHDYLIYGKRISDQSVSK